MKRHDEWRRILALLLVAGLSGASGVAYAQVPTVEDIAGCNWEARDQRTSGAASPIAKDEAGAATARRARDERPTRSPDPQIHGMDAAGAHDALYRAAYRVCMRRSGF